jgi:hypothetical protein
MAPESQYGRGLEGVSPLAVSAISAESGELTETASTTRSPICHLIANQAKTAATRIAAVAISRGALDPFEIVAIWSCTREAIS